MSYNYEIEKPKVFTDEGQRDLIRVLNNVNKLIEQAGAVSFLKAVEGIGGDSWYQLALLDHLIELGQIQEATPVKTWGQHRVFVKSRNNSFLKEET